MVWQNYYQRYVNYELTMSQTRLLTIVVAEIVKQWPQSMPEAQRRSLELVFATIFSGLKEVPADVREQVLEMLPDDLRHLPDELPEDWFQRLFSDFDPSTQFDQDFVTEYVRTGARLAIVSSGDLKMHLERLVCCQELVMLFAHLDAFFTDSLWTICKARPEVLKSGKQISWDNVVSSGGWEELLNQLTEQYVYEFGFPSVIKRVGTLRERMKLAIECQESDLKLLEDGENTRNIVVHNGGRVNQEYITKMGSDGLVVGELVPITLEYVTHLSSASRMLARQLFVAVSKKYFGIDDSKLTIDALTGLVKTVGL